MLWGFRFLSWESCFRLAVVVVFGFVFSFQDACWQVPILNCVIFHLETLGLSQQLTYYFLSSVFEFTSNQISNFVSIICAFPFLGLVLFSGISFKFCLLNSWFLEDFCVFHLYAWLSPCLFKYPLWFYDAFSFKGDYNVLCFTSPNSFRSSFCWFFPLDSSAHSLARWSIC